MSDVASIKSEAKKGMDKALQHLEQELLKIRAGKANPSMLDSVSVEYYGNPTPLTQVANVGTPDARTITVQPWEKSLLDDISTAIQNANLGFTPQNNGEMIIISIPPLTEERRKELVKKARSEAENAKVGIRNARKDANDEIKHLKNDGLAEDEAKSAEAAIQKLTDDYVAKADQVVDNKEADIMRV